MASQTPITDEIQSYGVVDNATLQILRERELSGELNSIEAEPILAECRNLMVQNGEFELQNTSLLQDTVNIVASEIPIEKQHLVKQIETVSDDAAKNEADAMLGSILK
ncbi:MAG: hypothetical protein ACK4NC_02325 [Candidatus Gracilibacteria bacterium]